MTLETPDPPGVHRETVLLAAMGLSPAVLTETLWALAVRDPAFLPHRVLVLTTAPGRDRLRELLFGPGAGWRRLLEELERREVPTAGKLRFGPAEEAVRVIPAPSRAGDLADILTREENETMADYFAETVRGLTQNHDIRLIASIAGGRKTMGALLHAVITLHGRSCDRITHVLVSDPWDRVGGFLYPGCPGLFVHPDHGGPLDSGEAEVLLSDVPFIPLRYLFEREIKRHAGGFSRLMNSLRERVAGLDDSLVLRLDGNPDQPVVEIGGKPIPMAGLHYAFLLYFAGRAVGDRGSLAAFSDLALEDLKTAALLYHRGREDRIGHWSHSVLERSEKTWDPETDPRRIASEIRSKLRTAGLDPVQIHHLVPHRGCLETALAREKILIAPPAFAAAPAFSTLEPNPTNPQPTGQP